MGCRQRRFGKLAAQSAQAGGVAAAGSRWVGSHHPFLQNSAGLASDPEPSAACRKWRGTGGQFCKFVAVRASVIKAPGIEAAYQCAPGRAQGKLWVSNTQAKTSRRFVATGEVARPQFVACAG